MALRLEINTGTHDNPRWQAVALDKDAEISVEEHSPLWNGPSTFSYTFRIPIEPNRHIVGNADEIFGASVYRRLRKRPFRLWVEGTLWLAGALDMDKEADLRGDSIEVNLTSGQKMLEDILQDVKARDVELPDDTETQLGYASLGAADIGVSISNYIHDIFFHPKYIYYTANATVRAEMASFVVDPKHTFTNITLPYHTRAERRADNRILRPYCNAGVCTQLWGLKDGKEGSDDEADYEKKRGYQTTGLGADRINPAPNFFVLHWLETLLAKYAKKGYDISALTAINGLRALCFVNTRCGFRKGRTLRNGLTLLGDSYRITDFIGSPELLYVAGGTYWPIHYDTAPDNDMHRFAERTRETIYTSKPELLEALTNCSNDTAFDTLGLEGLKYFKKLNHYKNNVNSWELFQTYLRNQPDYHNRDAYTLAYNLLYKNSFGTLILDSAGNPANDFYSSVTFRVPTSEYDYTQLSAQIETTGDIALPDVWCDAYATADNFPDVAAQDIIEALEKGFGCKLVYDAENDFIQAILYRDVLAQNTATRVPCVISAAHKKENDTRGFRLRYNQAAERRYNKFTGEEEMVSGSEDTTFNYNDYGQAADSRVTVKTLSQDGTDTNSQYCQMIRRASSSDYSLYISTRTGDAFRWKVDSSAQNERDWFPSLFEVGGFRSVEVGDCTDKDYVQEVSIPFSPVIVNDVNVERQKDARLANTDKEARDNRECHPVYRFYCADAEYHPRRSFAQMAIGDAAGNSAEVARKTLDTLKAFATTTNHRDKERINSLSPQDMHCTVDYAPRGQDTPQYNISFRDTDSGQALRYYDGDDKEWNPFNKTDTGFTLGFMRVDEQAQTTEELSTYDTDYDGQGNSKYAFQEAADKCQITSDSCDTYGTTLQSPLPTGDAASKLTDTTPLSLKLKAEKPLHGDERPFRQVTETEYNEFVEDTRGRDKKIVDGKYYVLDYEHGNPLYYPVTDNALANRGLYDRFWADYARFVTRRKTAVLTIPRGGIEPATLRALRFDKKYTLGKYTGWLNSVKYAVSDNGLSDVTIELYYI